MQAGWQAIYRGDLDRATALVDESLEVVDPDDVMGRWDASVRWQLQGHLVMGRDLVAAAEFLEQAAHHARASGAPLGLEAQHWVTRAALLTNARHADAVSAAEQALDLAKQAHAPSIIEYARTILARTLAEVDPERARGVLAELDHEGRALTNEEALAHAAARLDDWPLVLRSARRTLEIDRRHATIDPVRLTGLFNLIAAGIAEDDPEGAATLLGAAKAMLTFIIETAPAPNETTPDRTGLTDITSSARRQARITAVQSLGDGTTRQHQSHGETMNRDQATLYAIARISNHTSATRT